MIRLEWSQVNLEAQTAWIYADQAKGGRDIHVSLNETAVSVLRRQLGKHPVRVFTFKGRPYNRAYTKAWQAALRRAGIENFRWHDIRHTWASWLAQKGVPLSDIQEMGGWETPSMVQRYAHLSPAHLAHRAKLLDGLIDTNSAQSPQVQIYEVLSFGGKGTLAFPPRTRMNAAFRPIRKFELPQELPRSSFRRCCCQDSHS